jgi:hypothetical protein
MDVLASGYGCGAIKTVSAAVNLHCYQDINAIAWQGTASCINVRKAIFMPITYSTDTSGNLITEVWTGEVTAECLEAHWKKYLADPKVLATRRTLVDLRNAQILFNGSELSALVKNIVEPLLNGKNWKTAIVVEKPVQYG